MGATGINGREHACRSLRPKAIAVVAGIDRGQVVEPGLAALQIEAAIAHVLAGDVRMVTFTLPRSVLIPSPCSYFLPGARP